MNRHIVVYIFTALLVLFASCGKHAVKDTGKIPIDIRKEKIDVKTKKDKSYSHGWWGKHSYEGNPWVKNVSRPKQPTAALAGKHLSVWQSHGSYYDKQKGFWKWQRPLLFSTTEDLFTQTIVVPYLIPMLENAGAVVFTPRERDWQPNEVIVDNDKGSYIPNDVIYDGYNPFSEGSVKKTHATKHEEEFVTYQPNIPESGNYAVYVSYTTEEKSVDDALYSVYHDGMRTDFHVNQRMGGGTWVYLGTFYFGRGSSEYNKIVVSSQSSGKGIVSSRAVRFGGGMGNISRGGSTSGLMRSLEGARYYAQWAGAPYNVYAGYKGDDDYKDDINVRSLMTNWLAGGSSYVPDKEGLKVPIDLALAVHSDAGYNNDGTLYGSLAVCTTNFNEGRLSSGVTRLHSRDLAQYLLDNSKRDLQKIYGYWNWRDLYDRNYSETRLPGMPSAIFETLSHESFADMRFGHDPDFKFNLARSIYKTILRYEAEAHGEKVVVQPLAPLGFNITLKPGSSEDNSGLATLSWVAQSDDAESSAKPSSYNVYMSMGSLGYDNGTNVSKTYTEIPIYPDIIYRFKITAVNDGGESFPTEELVCMWHANGTPTVAIVNGFKRLSSPAIIAGSKGKNAFSLEADPGLSYGPTACWATAGLTGKVVAGNDFNYSLEHARAIAAANYYNIVSTSKEAVEWGNFDLSDYKVVDLLLGNEKNDGHSLKYYKTFSEPLQQKLYSYVAKGQGAILCSGSYVASDMLEDKEIDFMHTIFHSSYSGTIRNSNYKVNGLQQEMYLINTINDKHYATNQSDVLKAEDSAFIAMQYADGQTAAVANNVGFHTFVMGFPFECINDRAMQATIMGGILAFLITP